LNTYRNAGYKVKELRSQPNSTIVGFPVTMALAEIVPEDKQVTAKDVHIKDHFKWISLLEKYWISGDFPEKGNQISYTATLDTETVSYNEYVDVLKEWMPKVKVCSVFPNSENLSTSFEYLPNQEISKSDFDDYVQHINDCILKTGIDITQSISDSELVCASGVCPI
jgi:hypothetical protein